VPPEPFVPALNRRWLTPLYDPLLRFVMRERSFKGQLVARLGAGPGQRILDLGCGTGTLTVMLKLAYAESEVSGLDIDPEILARAARKATRAGVDVELRQGSATALPWASETFDHVVSCLMFHHLKTAQKRQAAAEVCRVLQPGGTLHLLDFGPPASLAGRLLSGITRHFEQTADNFAGRVPAMLAAAGLSGVHEADRRLSPFGPLVLVEARRPAMAA
jgi:ubiquinone/menaquinone biosynthesis C-methylase UbiE